MTDEYGYEGDEVNTFEVRLPAITLQCDEPLSRGTYLNLAVQVRVRGYRVDEDRKGNLVRTHHLVLDECRINDVLTPEMRRKLLEEEAAIAADLEPKEPVIREEPSPTELVDPLPPTGFDTDPVNTKPDDEDDDPEHAWMDEDDDPAVHAVVEYARAS